MKIDSTITPLLGELFTNCLFSDKDPFLGNFTTVLTEILATLAQTLILWPPNALGTALAFQLNVWHFIPSVHSEDTKVDLICT